METKRIEWIDTAKGIAMILVILGHIPNNSYMSVIIYAFHMPLFFVLSGCLLNKKLKFKDFLIKRIKTLIFPLVGYSLIIILFRYIYYVRLLHNESVGDVIDRVIGIFVQMKTGTYGSCLWFLPCLFIAQLITYPVIKYVREKNLVVAVIILYVLGNVAYYLASITGYLEIVPWCLDYVLLAASMIMIGYIIRIKSDCEIFNVNYMVYIYGFIFFITTIISYNIYGVTCMFSEQKNIILVFIESVTGILFTLQISKRITKWKLLKYIGKNSLFYYAMQFIVFSIPNLLIYNILKINAMNLNDYQIIIFDVVYMIITLAILWILNETRLFIKNKYKEHKNGI